MKNRDGGTKNAARQRNAAFELMSSMIAAILVVTVVFVFFFRVVSVSGTSMCDTLQNGDRLVLTSRFYTPERGDIVVIFRAGEEPLIKRVIAVAGDTLDIDPQTGLVLLNGELQQESYVKGGVTPAFGFVGPITVPAGYVFAMGDNRSDSLDSRELGAFPVDNILGEVAFRLWPFTGSNQLK